MDYNKKSAGGKVFYEGPRQHSDDIRYLRGSNIYRFYLEPRDLWLRHNWKSLLDKKLKEHVKVNVKAYVDHPKIFTRQTADEIIAAVAYEGFYNQKSLHSIHPKPETKKNYAIEFFAAILNSELATHYYRKLSDQEVNKVYAQIKIDRLQRIPIPQIDFSTPSEEREQELKKAHELYERSLSASDAKPILEFVETQLTAKRADVIHDLLAFLAKRMMKMSQQKRMTARQFLTDLKDFHGIDARALNPKTKLDEFWKLEAADVFAHMRKNTKILTAQNVRLSEEIEETIRTRFSKSKGELIPLEAQIAFTDRMVDQIVYRLYGLSDAEIGIVEEAN